MQFTIIFILALGLLILIHELGHFIAAKAVGIPIQEFGIGFPPRMLTLFRAGGTEFTLNWLPVGGFVRPQERPDDHDVPDEMLASKPWRRIVFLLAGSTVNIVAAILLLATSLYTISRNLDHILIGGVDENSPAEMAGLVAEDQVLAINGYQTVDVTELQELIKENAGNQIELTILRGEETFTTTLVPRTQDQIDPQTEGAIGVRGLYDPRDYSYLEAVGSSAYGFYYLTINVFNQALEFVGLKGMHDAMRDSIQQDMDNSSPTAGSNTIWYLASISYSLGILNLFPVPIFDGGKILFTLWEMVTRRRVPINIYYVLNMASLAFVLLLMIYINVRDFVNPVIEVVTQTPIP
ncbi:MAG: site-2 protease family protein [Anaerolineales bacterium]|nr:site-2 protease family protein [Anaerolineales bacterium]